MATREAVLPVLLEKVYQLIRDKFESQQQINIIRLAQHLFSNVSEDDLLQRNESDLYGAIVSLWHHLNDTSQKPISVRVFNPTVKRNGWQSTHTVLEISVSDSPFLVDSVKMALNRMDLSCHLMIHGPTQIERDQSGRILTVNESRGSIQSIFHIEVDRINDEQEMLSLVGELEAIFSDIALIVNAWQPMANKLEHITKELHATQHLLPGDTTQISETIEFLNWLRQHNFTFMGYKEFDLLGKQDDLVLTPADEPGLGLYANTERVRAVKLTDFYDSARLEAQKPYLLILTKGNKASKIHRPAYTDYIGIKKFNSKGKVIGEHRFTGLYTSAVYNQSVASIPLIGDKVERILQASGYRQGSYSYKALRNILENYPRDELLQASEHDLLEVGMGVVQMQDRDLLRLFVRKDPFGRFFSCMVYVIKDRYNTQLRKDTQRILKQWFGCDQQVEFTTYFSESPLARTHYIVRVDNNNMDVDVKAIERNLMEVSATWDDRLTETFVANMGESVGLPLAKRFAHAFPRSYKEDTLAVMAVADIDHLLQLNVENKLSMLFYRPQELASDSKRVRLKLYHRDEPIHLSDVMPMLENLGLRVIGESPYEIVTSDGETYWILDFSMLHKSDQNVDLQAASERFQCAFADIWAKRLDSDGFNRLILSAGLTGREVSILRAYARYMRQVGFPFSQHYIEDTFDHYPELAKDVIKLFEQRFKPSLKGSKKGQARIIDKITQQLEQVENLDDDRIIRRYVEMISATLRTNYYQTDRNNMAKAWLSLKLDPQSITDIPAPVPAYEIFVYSPDVEGVHLRGGKVARGGLRWSDRQEDFRTEILGLVKAQQVKNTVIIPVGAKGGFVCKHQPLMTSRQEIFAEGQRCYKMFICGLLDVTDNIVDGQVSPPKQLVRHDDDDPYLVVAADKGTATFSDLANSVSKQYDFWLGDAFASGGSNGYDHKVMGITAKGGWESVKRHFREMGIDCQTESFTAIGIGDMAGDVFGNGMLLSKQIRLVAAFNHMHIFIDPNPDAAKSWIERKRLFDLAGSTWLDYDSQLISKGGGVFSRRSKSIDLTCEVQRLLGTRKTAVTPNELIQMLLRAPVDLLWNGGIGTYVKSINETHSDVGDRANDIVRIDGVDLQAKVVGEGGNLGLTQLGRIEYALNGGRVNSDFVDNVGGVDCSDNEVNIKVLLNSMMSAGDLTLKQRNKILDSMEDEVAAIVLNDAYCQSESISVTDFQGVGLVKEQIRFIHTLEKLGYLDRSLENIPTDEALLEREKQGIGLTRPELSVLIAYGKMVLKQDLVHDHIYNEPYHQQLLVRYFPSELQCNYSLKMNQHPLHREIIATSLANQIVNEMGCNFAHRLQEETGASIIDIANAYVASRAIFSFEGVFADIRSMDNVASAAAQYDLLSQVRRTLRRMSRWILRNHPGSQSIDQLVERYKVSLQQIDRSLDNCLVAEEVVQYRIVAQNWIEQGVEEPTANYVARLSSLLSAGDIVEIARQVDTSVELASKAYFTLGSQLSLHWFRNQINNQVVDNNWQALARAAFREDLAWQQRQLTIQVFNCQCNQDESDVTASLNQWSSANQISLQRWETILNEFKVGNVHEFAKFSVALRELSLLNLNCAK